MSVPLPAESPGLAARLASALRRRGWKGLAGRYFFRYASRLVRHHSDIVLSKDLAEGDEASHAAAPLQVCAFEGGDPAVLDRIAAAPDFDPGDMERLSIFVRRGYRALFAEAEGRIVGYLWWVDGSFSGERAHPHLARYGIRLGARDAYAFDFFLEPAYRGGGNANGFLSSFDQHLRSRGIERVWGFVASENKPARWLYTLCGWRPRKVIDSLEIARCLLIAKNGVFVRDSRRRGLPSHDYRRVA